MYKDMNKGENQYKILSAILNLHTNCRLERLETLTWKWPNTQETSGSSTTPNTAGRIIAYSWTCIS